MPYRQIHTSIWSEDWFEPLSAHAKLMALYLIAHPNLSPAGFVSLSNERILFDTKLPALSLPQISREIIDTARFRFFLPSLWWVVRSMRYQGSGAKWQIAIVNSLNLLPKIAIDNFYSVYDKVSLSPSPRPLTPQHNTTEQQQNRTQPNPTEHNSGIATLSIPHPYPSDTLSIPHQKEVTPLTPQTLLAPEVTTTTTTTTQDNDLATVCGVYEDNIGLLTSITGDTLRDALTLYPAAWICDAIKLAVKAEKRNWLYCEAILKRWQNEGKNDGRKRQKTGKTEFSDTESTFSRALRQATASQR